MSTFYNNGINQENLFNSIFSGPVSSGEGGSSVQSQRKSDDKTGLAAPQSRPSFLQAASFYLDVNTKSKNNTNPLVNTAIRQGNVDNRTGKIANMDSVAYSFKSSYSDSTRPVDVQNANSNYFNGSLPTTSYDKSPSNTGGSSANTPPPIDDQEFDSTQYAGWYCKHSGTGCSEAEVFYYNGEGGALYSFCVLSGPYDTNAGATDACASDGIPVVPPSTVNNQVETGFFYTALVTKLDPSDTISSALYQKQANIAQGSKLIVSTGKYLNPGSYVRDLSSLGLTDSNLNDFYVAPNVLNYCYQEGANLNAWKYNVPGCQKMDYTPGFQYPHPENGGDIRDIVGGPFIDSPPFGKKGCETCQFPTAPDEEWLDPPDDDVLNPAIWTQEKLNEHYKFGYAGFLDKLEDGIYVVHLLNRDVYPLSISGPDGNQAPYLPWTIPSKRPDHTWPNARPFAIAVQDGMVRFRPDLNAEYVGTQSYTLYGNYTEEEPVDGYLGPTKGGQCFNHSEPEMTVAQATIYEATYPKSWMSQTWDSNDESWMTLHPSYSTNIRIQDVLYDILGVSNTIAFEDFLESYNICDRYSVKICDRTYQYAFRVPLDDGMGGTVDTYFYYDIYWCGQKTPTKKIVRVEEPIPGYGLSVWQPCWPIKPVACYPGAISRDSEPVCEC